MKSGGCIPFLMALVEKKWEPERVSFFLRRFVNKGILARWDWEGLDGKGFFSGHGYIDRYRLRVPTPATSYANTLHFFT